MTILLEQRFPDTLAALTERLARCPQGTTAEAWTFDDLAARTAAQDTLAALGITARLRSAYKPLVHEMLESIGTGAAVDIALPAHEAGSAARWRLEAYPLAGLLPGVTFRDGTAPLHYQVRQAGIDTMVFAPNRLRPDPLGQTALTPCGWLRLIDPTGMVIEDGPIETGFEQIYAAVMACVAGHVWPEHPPFFTTLRIKASLPGIERPLAYGCEVISTTEALHEDLYFSILEWLKHRAGLAPMDRTLQPGHIVPDIRLAPGPALLRVTLLDAAFAEHIQPGPDDLETADRPLTPFQIQDHLAALGGAPFSLRSVQGRVIAGTMIAGDHAPVVITAGQHANETASVVGGLRAMRRLVAEGAGALGFIPMENPDGHALHHTLRAVNPCHMLHAARYTALGDDLESRQTPPLHEKQARLDAIARLGARFHISLHGYPSHEWTRPLSGYLPRGFELWTIPKGFFLILRHRPGLAAQATRFAETLADRIAEDRRLRDFNERQLAVWLAHAGAFTFPVFSTIPCLITEGTAPGLDYTLITEYPDETIYGDAFRLAHDTQLRTVLAAVALFRSGLG